MSTIFTSSPPITPIRPRPSAEVGIPRTAAWLMALGSFLSLAGFAWDVQWHTDVGPDTFFTLPHLFIYAGSAIVGLVCLVMSLRILNRARISGNALSLAPIPRAYLIAGFGTVIFLACGLWDEWWHSIYGFDVTIMSPPHIGLLTSIEIGMVGTFVAFASSHGAHRVAPTPTSGARFFRSATIGLAFVAASAASFALFFGEVATIIPLGLIGVDPYLVYLATTFVVAMTAAAAATRARFAATLVAVFAILIKWLFDGFSIAATDWYADSLGLFIRDESLAIERFSSFASIMPFWAALLVAGLIIDLLVMVGIRFRMSGRIVVAIAGALSAMVLGMAWRVGAPYAELIGVFPSLPTVIALLPIGTVGALIAWQLGNLARFAR